MGITIVVPPVIMVTARRAQCALAVERHLRERPRCPGAIYRREGLFLMARAVASTPEIVIINKKIPYLLWDFLSLQCKVFVQQGAFLVADGGKQFQCV